MSLPLDPRRWLSRFKQRVVHEQAPAQAQAPEPEPQPQLSQFFEVEPERAAAITDPELRSKLLQLPRIIYDWVGPYLDLAEASILDYGCGAGTVALGLAAQLRPRRVVGVDIHTEFEALRSLAHSAFGMEELPPCLELRCIAPDQPIAKEPEYDFALAWAVFEHVDRKLADKVVDNLAQSLRPGGYCMMGVSPLYYSAFGSHLETLITRPWAHLLEQHNHLEEEAELSRQRIAENSDPERQRWLGTIWNCYTTLNKFTGDELVELFERHGFEVLRDFRTDCSATPPPELTRIYAERILKNEQIVLLLRKRSDPAPSC